MSNLLHNYMHLHKQRHEEKQDTIPIHSTAENASPEVTIFFKH